MVATLPLLVLVLALARPELRDVRPSLAEGGRRVAGVIVLHENFTAGMAIGFVLVLAGSVLATRRPVRLESQSSV